MNPDEELPEYDNSQEMEHARWKGAAASLSKSLDEGQITPEEHKQFYQSEIAPRLQRFDAMKQATAKKQMDQQQQLAMQQHAHQTAMDHQATSFRARNVHDLVGTYTDPLTGKTAHMIENDKGDWGPVEFPEEDSGEEGGEEDGGQMDYFPQTGGMEVGATGTSPDSHTMNINVGGQQTQATFGKQGGQWRQTGMQKFNQATGQWEDYNPNQQQPQQVQSSVLPSHGEMQELWKRANDAIRLPQGQLRDHAVANTFDHMLKLHTTDKMRKAARADRAKAQSEHDTRLAKAKADTADQAKKDKEAAAKEKAEQHEEGALSSAYHKHLDKIDKEHHEANSAASKAVTDDEKAAAAKLQKDYHGSQEAKEEEAMNRARREREKITGKKKEPEKQNVGTSAQSPTDRPEEFAKENERLKIEHNDTLHRIGMNPDGKTLNLEGASEDHLHNLYAQLAAPKRLGVKPEVANAIQKKITDIIGKRQTAAAAAKANVPKEGAGINQLAGAAQGSVSRNSPFGGGAGGDQPFGVVDQ